MRVIKLLFVFGIAADLVILLCCTVSWLFEPGDRIYDFLFDRSAVQYVTLFAFALAMTLLGCRFIRHVRSMREVRRIQYAKDPGAMPDSPLSNHIGTLADTLARYDAGVALSHAERFTQRQHEDIQQAYDAINFLVCSLPALGLFGTMLGLSGALSAAFSKANLGPDSIQTFISSLGTALDTTVLALACAMVAGPTAWLLNRMEKLLHQQRIAVIHAVSGLNRFNHQLNAVHPASSRGTQDLDAAEILRDELQASVAGNMTEITSRFDECLGRLEDLARMSMEHSVQSDSKDVQMVNRSNLAEAVTSSLNEAMQHIKDMIVTHNTEAINTVSSVLNRFTGALDERIPRELIISYSRNGVCGTELNHVT